MEKFVAYEVALDLISGLRPLVGGLKTRNKDLADQMKCAAESVVLNIAVGYRRVGKDRLHFFRIAQGSASEVGACLDVAARWGEIASKDAEAVMRLLGRELALLRGLAS